MPFGLSWTREVLETPTILRRWIRRCRTRFLSDLDVCLHLLVVCCNFTSFPFVPPRFFMLTYLLEILFFIVFTCFMFPKKKQPVGWPDCFHAACFIIVLILSFYSGHAVPKVLKYKPEIVTLFHRLFFLVCVCLSLLFIHPRPLRHPDITFAFRGSVTMGITSANTHAHLHGFYALTLNHRWVAAQNHKFLCVCFSL